MNIEFLKDYSEDELVKLIEVIQQELMKRAVNKIPELNINQK